MRAIVMLVVGYFLAVWLIGCATTTPEIEESSAPASSPLALDEDQDEVDAPPLPDAPLCPVACGTTCTPLAPGSAQSRDDASSINACIRDCGCVQLTGGKYLLRHPISVNQKPGAKLLGPAPSQPNAILKVNSTCESNGFVEDFLDDKDRTTKQRRKFVIDINRSANVVLGTADPSANKGFLVRVQKLRQSCRNFGIFGNYVMNLRISPDSLVSDVQILGKPPQGPGVLADFASDAGGIFVNRSDRIRLRGNLVQDLGYAISNDPPRCSTSAGFAGIKVQDSREAKIQQNRVIHVAFGIALTNEGGGDGSDSRIVNNTVVGAALLRCMSPAGECTDPNERFTVRCSQGRAIRVGLESGTPTLRRVLVSGNTATEFGGRAGKLNGSGLDLTGNVADSTITNNVIDGRNAQAEFGLQVRTGSFNNSITGNTFYSDRDRSNGDNTPVKPCRSDGASDVNFQTADVRDQCGIGRKQNSGRNTYRSARAPNCGDNLPAMCPSGL